MFFNIEQNNNFALSQLNKIIYTKPDFNEQQIKLSNKKDTIKKDINKLDERYRYETNKFIFMLYIILEGYHEFKDLNQTNLFKTENKFRFKLIDTIKNKNNQAEVFFKNHKIKSNEMISELGNNMKLSFNTFKGLCFLNKINIVFLKNKVCELLCFNDTYPIMKCDINNNILYTEEISKKYIMDKYYLVENINKPFYSVSHYKVGELRNICEKVEIPTKNDASKNFTKAELYSKLMYKIEL